jgi:hypothetical protein
MERMKYAWGYWGLIVLIVLGSWQSAEALRCQNRLVSSGDSPIEVLGKCGTPTLQQYRQEEIETFEPVFIRGKQVLVARRITVPVEIWTYNFGPHSLIYVVVFRNDRVVDIRTQGYGY